MPNILTFKSCRVRLIDGGHQIFANSEESPGATEIVKNNSRRRIRIRLKNVTIIMSTGVVKLHTRMMIKTKATARRVRKIGQNIVLIDPNLAILYILGHDKFEVPQYAQPLLENRAHESVKVTASDQAIFFSVAWETMTARCLRRPGTSLLKSSSL